MRKSIMSAEGIRTALAVALVGALLCVTPALSQPTLQFGVRVPLDRVRAPVIVRERRGYFWRTAVLVAGFVVASLFVPAGTPWLTLVLVLSQIAVGLGCYFIARERILAAKTAEDWFGGVKQTVTADTTWRTEPERFPVLWLLPALAVIAATVVIGAVRYPHLPARLPVHFTASGGVDRYADKSVWTAFVLVAVQIFVTTLIAGLLALTYRSRPEVDAAGSAQRYRRFLYAMSRAALAMAALIDVSMLLVSLHLWQVYQTSDATVALAAVPPLLGVVAVLAVSLRMGQAGSRLPDAAPAGRPTTNRDDDRYWKGGLIYVNREDPAVIVARRFGVGWTLNFGNPRARVVFAVIVLALATLVVAVRLR
jgi:uncharacterized membrane protein